jgi:hypothetical protein
LPWMAKMPYKLVSRVADAMYKALPNLAGGKTARVFQAAGLSRSHGSGEPKLSPGDAVI